MGRSLKLAEYYLFVQFVATPKHFRDLKTQLEFQIQYNVAHSTLANWKKDPNFWEDVNRAIKEWAKEKTPDVIAAVYARIMKTGDPMAARLWLQYIQGWAEDTMDGKNATQDFMGNVSQEKRELIRLAFANFGIIKPKTEPDDKTTESQ